MKNWMLVLALVLASLVCDPAEAQQTCPLSVSGAVPAAATGTLLAAVGTGTGRYFVCGYAIAPVGGTGQLSFGATCAALGTPLSAAVPSGGYGVDSSPFWRGATPVPAGQSICITGGAGSTGGSVIVYYGIN